MVALSQIMEFAGRIASEFDPERVVLFGSHAHGRADEHSDVDLLVILRFQGSAFRKSLEILNAVRPTFPIDLIVRNPEDAERRLREHDPLIVDALEHGRVLYERNG